MSHWNWNDISMECAVSRYCWTDSKSLFSCYDDQIIHSTLEGISETDQTILGKGERNACMGGVLMNKPVYAIDKHIYWGQKLVYTTAEDVDQLFVGQTQVAYIYNNFIGVIDLNGDEIFSKTITDYEQLLAFSEKKGTLYLLTNNRTCIESCDILNNGKMSSLCNIDKISKMIKVR